MSKKITYTTARIGCRAGLYWIDGSQMSINLEIKHTPLTKEQSKSLEEGMKKLGEEE